MPGSSAGLRSWRHWRGGEREDPASAGPLDQARQQLGQAWGSFALVEVSQDLVERAGRIAEAFALRAYDSVQLAAADLLRTHMQAPVTLACFDRRLCQAAALLHLDLLG